VVKEYLEVEVDHVKEPCEFGQDGAVGRRQGGDETCHLLHPLHPVPDLGRLCPALELRFRQ
jgi:hypothetical protein